jgi:2,3,4,5-tetrahydropyridine-2-carboxylate N-succinyltransferase
VSGTRIKSFPGGDFGLPCVVVLRVLEEGAVHDKLQLNDILREHGIST